MTDYKDRCLRFVQLYNLAETKANHLERGVQAGIARLKRAGREEDAEVLRNHMRAAGKIQSLIYERREALNIN